MKTITTEDFIAVFSMAISSYILCGIMEIDEQGKAAGLVFMFLSIGYVFRMLVELTRNRKNE